MPVSEFERCIWDSLKNKFIYGDSSEGTLREAKTWSQDKIRAFKQILVRIKRKQGYWQDPSNKNGKIVNLPIRNRKYIAVFFEPQLKGQFYIYKIDIGDNRNIIN